MSNAPVETTIALSPAELESVRAMIETRSRVGQTFSVTATGMTAAFLVRTLFRVLRARHRISPEILAFEIGIVVVVSAIVWYFGWRPLLAMRRDLSAGVKRVKAGAIQKLDRIGNAYGETITWVTIDGTRLLTKTDAFAKHEVGDRVTVEYLPGAKIVLGVRAGAVESS